MLPRPTPSLREIAGAHGKGVMEFSQDADFPIGLSHGTRRGACYSIAFAWIRLMVKNSLNPVIADFAFLLLRPSMAGDIERFYASLEMPELKGMKPSGSHMHGQMLRKLEAETGMQCREPVECTGRFFKLRAEQLLAGRPGFNILNLRPRAGLYGHVLAILTRLTAEGAGLEYIVFDPNFGTIVFPSSLDFSSWLCAQLSEDQRGEYSWVGSMIVRSVV